MNNLKVIRRIINNKSVVNVPTLRASLSGRSRCSIFRDLSKLKHLSSFTHAGGYFTLPDIPHFDANGLWFSGDVGFSIHGTLKNAVNRTVSESESGHTHEELEEKFRIRVHNVLLDLVRLKRIARKSFSGGKSYLYLSSDERRGRNQFEKRQRIGQRVIAIEKTITPMLMIQILVEVIRDCAVQISAVEIQQRLARQGMAISLEQVEYVFAHNGIGVKKTPPSR